MTTLTKSKLVGMEYIQDESLESYFYIGAAFKATIIVNGIEHAISAGTIDFISDSIKLPSNNVVFDDTATSELLLSIYNDTYSQEEDKNEVSALEQSNIKTALDYFIFDAQQEVIVWQHVYQQKFDNEKRAFVELANIETSAPNKTSLVIFESEEYAQFFLRLPDNALYSPYLISKALAYESYPEYFQ